MVPEEILTDHPDRFRAMIVESSNPAHSLANSAACREAFASLELMVVIDVAMTETAWLAHYVLPAASQFEKPEATFFNLKFPRNTFQLRRPLLTPAAGHAARTRDLGPAGAGARRGDGGGSAAAARRRAARPARLHRSVPDRCVHQSDCGAATSVCAVRNAGANPAGRTAWRRRAVGSRPKGRPDLSGGGAPRRSRRRQRAVRRHPGQPVGGDVHRARLRGRLHPDRPPRPQDRARNPGDAAGIGEAVERPRRG